MAPRIRRGFWPIVGSERPEARDLDRGLRDRRKVEALRFDALADLYWPEPADAAIPRDVSVRGKTLVVVSLPSEGPLYFSWARRTATGTPGPAATRILATSFHDVSVTRLDETTLEVRPEQGFFASEVHQLLRDPSHRSQAGDVVELSDVTVTVTEITADGRPRAVRFHFAAPLESPRWLWMHGKGLALADWTPPKVGKTVVVSAAL